LKLALQLASPDDCGTAAYLSGDYMTNPSPLGEAIEVAIETGRVFAVERVTLSQITLWLPEDETVRVTAEKEGLTAPRACLT
jgi:hypothetical protein